MIDLESIEEILDLGKPATLLAKGTSMFPEIVYGDKISLKPCREANDQDIVFVLCKGKYLIHRYHKAENKTKGDNCTSFDPPIDKIIAKVTSVKKTPRSLLSRVTFRITQYLSFIKV